MITLAIISAGHRDSADYYNMQGQHYYSVDKKVCEIFEVILLIVIGKFYFGDSSEIVEQNTLIHVESSRYEDFGKTYIF